MMVACHLDPYTRCKKCSAYPIKPAKEMSTNCHDATKLNGAPACHVMKHSSAERGRGLQHGAGHLKNTPPIRVLYNCLAA